MGHGKLAGSGCSSASSAGGPPVEVPTSTKRSAASREACRAGPVTGSEGRRGATGLRWAGAPAARSRMRSRRRCELDSRALAAIRTLSTKTAPNSSTFIDTAPPGLAMKSTAPRANASSVSWAPSAVNEENITTGHGLRTMTRSRQARPLRPGIWISKVTTSGRTWSSSASASAPSRATATSKSPAASKISVSRRRISAESSTTRSLITRRLRPGRRPDQPEDPFPRDPAVPSGRSATADVRPRPAWRHG
jgi:hypothetical protein